MIMAEKVTPKPEKQETGNPKPDIQTTVEPGYSGVLAVCTQPTYEFGRWWGPGEAVPVEKVIPRGFAILVPEKAAEALEPSRKALKDVFKEEPKSDDLVVAKSMDEATKATSFLDALKEPEKKPKAKKEAKK